MHSHAERGNEAVKGGSVTGPFVTTTTRGLAKFFLCVLCALCEVNILFNDSRKERKERKARKARKGKWLMTKRYFLPDKFPISEA
jgi:hypothetical protein